MATKLQYYSSLADETAAKVTGSRGNWTGFLETAARLYKYPFDEQLMIYAQRPDATACASLETWNKPMNRWVRRGSKGIALIDNSGTRPYLKYVFDVTDTEAGRQNARKPYLWELKQEHEAPVMESLAKSYGGYADVEGDLGTILYNIAKELANEYYNDNARDIGYSVEGSFLEELDDFNIGMSFREALTVSTAYCLMYRCGLDASDYLADEDFQSIFDFNTLDTVNALGTAVSDLSQQVLREIGIVIRNYERQQAVERSMEHGEPDIQPRGGLSDPRPDIERADGGTGDRQVRPDAEELSEGTPPHPVQFPGSERTAISSPVGDRPDGEPDAGADGGRPAGEEPGPGQDSGSDGLGTAHEQPESTGGGTDSGRTDIQLNDDTPEEIPPAQEQPEPGGISLPEQPEQAVGQETPTYSQVGNTLDQTEQTPPAAPVTPLAETLAGSAISPDAADIVLRDGGNQRNSSCVPLPTL